MATSTGSKRLFIVGATGGIGRALVEQALERGHRVTAFVRSPEKLGPPRDALQVLRGDPRSVDELRGALQGHDAVLSALGPPGPGASTIVSDCARSMVTAMPEAGVRRLLIVGVAVLFDHLGIVPSILRRTLLRNIATDSAEMERVVTSSDLDWTVVRPPRLTNGPLTKRYAVADDRMPPGIGTVLAWMSRADVAHFMLDELEQGAHVRRIVGAASSRKATVRPGSVEARPEA